MSPRIACAIRHRRRLMTFALVTGKLLRWTDMVVNHGVSTSSEWV